MVSQVDQRMVLQVDQTRYDFLYGIICAGIGSAVANEMCQHTAAPVRQSSVADCAILHVLVKIRHMCGFIPGTPASHL